MRAQKRGLDQTIVKQKAVRIENISPDSLLFFIK